MAEKTIYTVGGTVQAGEGIYISRKADDELLSLCRLNTFAYVLTPRQMGKSSLMERTAERLRSEGYSAVTIDLSQMGTQLNAEQWYLGILTIIEDNLELDTDLTVWWQQHRDIGVVQRLTLFFKEVLLSEISNKIVIFIDEVDTTLNLRFTDDFFALIRYLYNARAQTKEFNRLSFVLIGVATPADLISDPQRTPFNIGQRVDLTDFTFEEAKPFAEGFGLPFEEAGQVLQWVIKWAGGHPYLTQRLCSAISEQRKQSWSESDVDQLVWEIFFDKKSELDNNLLFVRDMLTKRAPDKVAVLSVYRKIRLGKHPVPDEEHSLIKSHLKLSGVVRQEKNELRVRNQIYAEAFNPRWIRENWPIHWIRRIPVAIWGLIASLLIALVVSLMYANAQREFAVKQKSFAAAEAEARGQAEREWQRAEEQTELANKNEARAIAAAIADSISRTIAEQERRRAEYQAQLAALKEEEAKAAAADADSARRMAEFRRKEVERFHRISIARFLAIQAPLQKLAGQDTLAALLARQAYLFNQDHAGQHANEIYEALRQSLNSPAFNNSGGPLELPGHESWVRSVAFNPQYPLLLSADDNGMMQLWNLQKPELPNSEIISEANGVGIKAAAFSPDGEFLASAGEDHTVRLWSNFPKSQPHNRTLTYHKSMVLAVAFSRDSKKLASADANGLALIWDLSHEIPACIDSIKLAKPVRSLAFSPVNEGIDKLAVGGDDEKVGIWELTAEHPVLSDSVAHGSRVNSLTFSPDGKLLVTGGYDGRVLIWKMDQSNRKSIELLGHTGPINSTAFSGDGKKLASGSADKSIRIWELEKLGNPLILQLHEGWVWSVAFSQEGNFLASGGADQKTLLWMINAETLAELVCKYVKRNLTMEEWKEYIGEDVAYQCTCIDLRPAEKISVYLPQSDN